MAFIVNSSPPAGLRFEPGETFDNANAALSWAIGLDRRGMRQVRIRDTVTGRIFEASALRAFLREPPA